MIEGEEDDRNPQVRWSWKETQTIVNFPNPCNALAVAHLSGCCWLWISETGTDLVDASSGYNFPYGLVV